jgi:putative methyltransferase (TIGR04325 family)
MKIFKKIQRLLPPFISDFIKVNLGYLGYAIWEYAPEGFKTKIKSGGWDLESIAVLQSKKWNNYSCRIKSNQNLGINHEDSITSMTFDPFFHNLLACFGYVIALSGIKKSTLNFLDWGGGIGHYGLLAEELIKTSEIPINYFCFDFPTYCHHGKCLNRHFNFVSEECQLPEIKFDLIMASSSIWYEVDWKIGLDKLCRINTHYLYITRMIFITKKPSYVAIQRPKLMGYDTEYLFWVINKNEFICYLEGKNFKLVREFEFGNVTPIFKAPEQGTMKGFLFVRKG